MGEVEVRIRNEDDLKSVHLTSWMLVDIETLFRELRSWNVMVDGEPRDQITGQVVLEDGRAFFEIIVQEDDLV